MIEVITAGPDVMNEALQKIERIKSIFMDTQLFCETQDNFSAIIEYLEKIEQEFRSVGYESASMAIALKDLQKSQGLDIWLLYAKGPALSHKAQVYVGLGWAIAKLNLPFLTVIEKIDPRLYHRVADGCGYYDGSFRQRQTVINQQIPVYLPEPFLPMYYRGVGRSLWYSSNADITRVRNKLDSFPPDHHADLWKGIGIAAAYAGGCEDDILQTLLQYAGTNSIQLAYGAALAARSRMHANTMTNDTDRCSRLWFALTARGKNLNCVDSLDPSIEDEEIYLNWIAQAEESLTNSHEKKN